MIGSFGLLDRRGCGSLIALLLVTITTSLPASAQFGGNNDDDLYFPPTLTVGMAQDMSAYMRIYGMGGGEEELPPIETSDELIFERTITGYNQVVPLPVIFFESGSSVLPMRYKTFNSSFDADTYDESDDIDRTYREFQHEFGKYYEILNIIGKRMDEDRSFTIELQGGYSTEPGEDLAIAHERADVVSEYLQRIWRIAPERITRREPVCFAEESDHLLAQEEARSLRIYPNDHHLLAPVVYSNSSIDLGILTVVASLQPNMPLDQIAGLRLSIASGDDLLGETVMPLEEGLIEGADPNAPTFHWTGMWFLPRVIETLDEGLSVNMIIETTEGRIRNSNTTMIPVRIEEERPDDDAAMREEAIDVAAAEEYYEETSESPTSYDEAVTIEASDYNTEYDGADEEEGDLDTWEPRYEATWISMGIPEPTSMISFETEDTLYRGSLHFFDHGDSTIGPLQELWLQDYLTDMREGYGRAVAAMSGWGDLAEERELAGDSLEGPPIGSIRWGVIVESTSDVSEDPEIDQSFLVNGRHFYESSIRFGMGLLSDPEFKVSLYVFPKFDPETPPDMERVSEEITRQMFGDRAHEIEAMQRDARHMYREEDEEMRDARTYRIDTLRTARAHGIGSWIAERFEGGIIDTVVVANDKTYAWESNLGSIDWLPEARFYARTGEARLALFQRRMMPVYDDLNFEYEEEDEPGITDMMREALEEAIEAREAEPATGDEEPE